ncbi:LysM peptidoglycan-binding domain-containing protein [Aeromonas dhakensis]
MWSPAGRAPGLPSKYGVSQARLVEINKLKSRDIQIGQVLYIPQK